MQPRKRNLLVTCLTIFSSLFATAQSLPLAGLAHVAFRVSSVEKTRAFYETLGFQQAFAFDKAGVVTQSFIKINDKQFVELYPARNEAPGYLHLCFASEDLEALAAKYRKDGLEPSPIAKGAAGNNLFGLKGPENQNIEYTQYLPGSIHRNDVGKHLGSGRVAESIFSTAVAMHDPSAAEAYYRERLGFPASTTHQFQIPGPSGQFVSFKPIGSHAADITFGVKSLKKTASELRKRGIKVSTVGDLLTIQDPDGITLGFHVAP